MCSSLSSPLLVQTAVRPRPNPRELAHPAYVRHTCYPIPSPQKSPSVAALRHNGPNLPPFSSRLSIGKGIPLICDRSFLRLLGVFSPDSFPSQLFSPFVIAPSCLLLEEGGGLDLRPPGGTLPLDSSWLSVLVSRDLVRRFCSNIEGRRRYCISH